MEREQYEVMARREERHWWYAGMRRAALALLASAVAGRRDLRILDAGCGTGGTTCQLQPFGRVYGVDVVWEALEPAAERGLSGHLARASVERLPFGNASFDVVTSFEVLYHLQVGSDERALNEFRRVLRPGGWLLLRLPAHDWLRGEHDRLVHTRHRYSRGEVAEKLRVAGFQVDKLSWANSLLFVPAVAKRLLERLDAETAETLAEAAEPDLWQPPAVVNAALESLVAVEALALPRGLPLPFGLSVIALARPA